jgi:hypothetical protein
MINLTISKKTQILQTDILIQLPLGMMHLLYLKIVVVNKTIIIIIVILPMGLKMGPVILLLVVIVVIIKVVVIVELYAIGNNNSWLNKITTYNAYM